MERLRRDDGFIGGLQLYAMIAVIVVLVGLATTVYIMSLRNKVLHVEIEKLEVLVVTERASKDNVLKLLERSNAERTKETKVLKKSIDYYRAMYEECVLGSVTECKVVEVEGCPTFRIEKDLDDPLFRQLKNMWYMGGMP